MRPPFAKISSAKINAELINSFSVCLKIKNLGSFSITFWNKIYINDTDLVKNPDEEIRLIRKFDLNFPDQDFTTITTFQINCSLKAFYDSYSKNIN